MKKSGKKNLSIRALEKRLMLDASIGALVSSAVFGEDSINAAAEVIDSDVTITGTTTDFDGENLTISTTGGAEDQLTIIDEGTGAGQIGFDGANVTYEGTLIGTLSSTGANGADLTIDLNANASKAAIERLIENITYQNISDDPTASRTLNVNLSTHFSEDVTITIVAQNDALSVTTNTGHTATEGGTTTITTADLNITDPDDIDTDIVFTTTTSPIHGQLELTNNLGVAVTSFTLDDIVNNRLIYVHDDSNSAADSFEFSVTDGDVTIAAQDFHITITPVNDPLTLDTNTGVTVFQNFTTTIGAEVTQFGDELLRYNAAGNYGTWDGTVDSKSTQYALVFTTPGANPTATPGQVLFESGGSGVGLGLVLNEDMQLDFYAGAASTSPRLSTDALAANTQYAVVVEIDQATDEIRIHYEFASDMSWFKFGRTAENTLTGYTATDHSGSGAAGVWQANSTIGGYNGTISGTTAFQGSIDSDVVVTEFPDTTVSNTILVANDLDTGSHNLVYTITTDVTDGTLYNDGVALALNDTFTQADLDGGLITYTNAGGTGDSFDFSVTDGTTVIAGQTFTITVDTNNVAPEILGTTVILDEDFEGGTSGWNNNSTNATNTTLSEFWGQFNRNIHTASNQELYQTFATSGTQDYITVEFDFYEIDTWDNEYFYIFVDDTNILGSSHRYHYNIFDQEADGTSGNVSYSVVETTERLGYIGFNAARYEQTYHYTLTIQTSDPTFKLGFGSSLNGTSLTDESFGIDNLKITEVGTGGAGTQEFYLSEFANNGDTVGTVQAIDANVGHIVTYGQTGGTGNGLFSIDANTGVITVTDDSTFDFDATTSYTLDITATDGVLTDTQTITIHMMDVLENTRPTVNSASFTISEDASNNDNVGTITSSDPEGDTVTYSIYSGNTGSAFKIDAVTGLIEVNDASQLDREIKSSYTLGIRGTDDNVLGLYHNRTITINLSDVDEAPSLDIEYVIESENTGVIYSADTGNFYWVQTANKSWHNALADAETTMLNGVGGHLVTITSAAEFNFVRDQASPSHIWIALSDEAEEGKWVWMAGPEAGLQITQGNTDLAGTYNHWNGSEPNSGSTLNWALMHSNSWWYDNWPSTNGYDSLVEWEGRDIINNDTYSVSHTSADASDVSNGDSVGFVQGSDPEGDTLDYTIEGGNADGIFEIDTATGEIRILDNTNLDATVQDSYTLTIRATETNGVKFDEIDITIEFVDDFSLTTNTALDADEAGTETITTAHLNVTDADTAATDIVFHVTTLPVNGQLELTTGAGFQINSFTLDDVQNNRVVFVHDNSETTSDSFEFSVTDGDRTSTGNTFNINVTPVNDAVVIATNIGTTVVEGASVTLDNTMLNSTDPDDAAADRTYTAGPYLNGHITVGGVTQHTFTQADIDNGDVVFVHDSAEGATANFAFSLADGLEDSATAATGTFTLTVTPVNDTPIITTNTGATVIEGASVTVTTAMLNVTDPDDSGAGLTYTLSNISNGQVELSTNAGVPIISFTQADLDANRVVFAHDGGENNAQFDVSVEDGGEHGAIADTATFNLTRTPVNDSPIVGVNTGSSVNQNSIVLIKNTVLAASDPDDSGTGLTFTVTGTTNGQVEFLANPNVAITSFTQDDIDSSRIVFRHSGPPGAADFDFSIADGGEDTSVAATGTFNLTVDNVNDAPTISVNAGPTVDEGSTTTLTPAMLDSFDPDDFGTGLDWTASNLVNGIIQVNGVTQNTFTQADLDNGLVTFIHDGSETVTAGFDISLADGGEDFAAPDTGTFTMGITPVNDGASLIVNDGSPNMIDFNDYTIDTFDPSQDGATAGTVSGDGATLTIGPNSWKKIDIPYTLTANTVLSLEFRADDVSEILGIGFDDDNSIADGVNGYQLGGTQTWSGMDQTFNSYDPGDGWVRFDIPVGADFVGVMDRLVFVLDDDASPTGTALFRNVNFYEADQVLDVDEGGTFAITNGHISSTDPDDNTADRTFTASNLSNGVIKVGGVTQNTFTQADLDNGDVTFVHDGSDTLNAGFDISLADGLEDSAVADTGSFTLIVNPINDPVTITTNTGATMNEGASLAITTAMLNATDSDDEGAQLTYSVSNLSNGVVQVSGVTRTSFTQDDLNQGRVTFLHDDSQTLTAAFDISLADGLEDGATADTGTFNITVTAVNDNVVLATNTGTNITESGTVTVTSAMLNTTDVDDTATGITYSVTATENGWVELSTNTGFPVTSFTQDDINNNRVVFRHDGSGSGAAEFDFSVIDGTENGTTAVTGTFALNVNIAVNEAPIIAITDGTPTSVDFSATTISAYDPGGAGDGQGATATSFDVSTDGSVLTIYGNAWKKIPMPITLTADTVLTFDFRSTKEGEIQGIGFDTDDSITNGVSGYNLFGTDNNGLFNHDFNTYNLGDDWVRYEIPVGDDFTGAVTDLFFMADDDGSVDAISQFRDVKIYEANPTVTVVEGASVTITSANLNAFDTDDSPANVTYTASVLTNGHITVGGVTQNTFTQADINNGDVAFVHDDSQTTTASFNISLADGLENGSTADTATFNMTVTPVDDAPILVTNTGDTMAEGGASFFTNAQLNATDVDNVNANLVYTISALPAGVIENTNTASTLTIGSSFTQGDIDNGFIRYTHDGGEESTETLSFTLSDGTNTLAPVDFTWNITPVNDAPDDLMISDTIIEENSDVGTWIGDLTALDVDLPGDSFTFSIMNDPTNMFAIVGNQLFSNAELDFETMAMHDLMIRADDGNDFVERMISIEVTDVDENVVVQTPNGRTGGVFNGFAIEEEKDPRRPSQSLIQASLSGSEFAQLNAFYGEDGLTQILREKTTFEIQNIEDKGPATRNSDPVEETTNAISEPETDADGVPQNQEKFTNIRQMLEHLKQFEDTDATEGEDGEGETNGEEEFQNIFSQFEDVLSYQEQRKAHLRQALLSD